MKTTTTSARPSWSTPRDPSRPTYGPAVARVAERLGRPFLPWQRELADVMGEVLPTGRLAYPTVVAIVPRRAGKTVLTLATSIQRASIDRRRRVWYTAQTGADAGDTFVNEWLPLVDDSAWLKPRVAKRLSNGSQALSLLKSGSRVGIFPPTRLGLHGKDADYVTVDEAWAFDEARGRDIEAGARPAMATRPRPQLVVISAAGDASSTWLLAHRDRGRRLVELGAPSRTCYVEFSPPHVRDGDGWRIDPAVDLDDPALWAATHPAVGHTIDLDFLHGERESADDPADFHRPYLGVFSSTSELAGAIPLDEWQACRDADAAVDGRVSIGYDVAHDGRWAAIAVACRRADGSVVVELAEYLPGDEWLVDRLLAMRLKHRASLTAMRGGPADAITAELGRRGVDVRELGGLDATTACAELLRDVRARTIAHRGQGALDTAAASAAKAERGDGWVFTRKRSTADIAPLIAAAAATATARATNRSTGPLYREAVG